MRRRPPPALADVRTIIGRTQLEPVDGPLFVVVGVFDGLHLGHAYLLEHLVREAAARRARPAVITFDAHPDAVLVGQAPPLLMDPEERLERLADAGVDIVVVEHFDDALRQTAYDAFVAQIAERCMIAGFLMTPDAAFGHERAGTPAALRALGDREGFEVVVVPPFALDGREIRSSDIRAAIAAGDLSGAERLLGRPYAVRGALREQVVRVGMPVALPPSGAYDGVLDGRPSRVEVAGGTVRVPGAPDSERVVLEWRR